MKKHIHLAILMAISAPAFAQWDAGRTQYDSDMAICERMTDSQARMQCRRDAASERDHAMKRNQGYDEPIRNNSREAYCNKCGTVSDIRRIDQQEASGGSGVPIGAIVGGIAGGLLGNQVGKGTGKTLATVAGVAGGAYAGNMVEKNYAPGQQQSNGGHSFWRVQVTFDDGTLSSYDYNEPPNMSVGTRVKDAGGKLKVR